MVPFTVLLTFLLLVVILAGAAWTAYMGHHRMEFLEGEYRRIRLASIEDNQQFEKQIQELTLRLEAAESKAAESAQRPLQSVNYTQRSQMLRMIRRGDTAGQIASNLSVPLSQVRLLMKLPGMAAPPAPNEASSSTKVPLKEKGRGAGQSG